MIDRTTASATVGRPPVVTPAGTHEGREWYEPIVESGLVPDAVLRAGIRRLLAQRLREEDRGDRTSNLARTRALVDELRRSPIAIRTDAANAQHYEVPAAFFEAVLGRHLKYSSGYWPDGVTTLDEAEAAMLDLTCRRARLADGQTVLDLGCGWGSLSLYMAARYPASRIVGVSNSGSQRAFIEAQAAARGLTNLTVVTADINDFTPDRRFDRVVSVEMFEHARNYARLLSRIAGWLGPDGLLFVHVFAHRRFAYPFEARDASDWMARHFFTGGLMPSVDLFRWFQEDLRLAACWTLDGTHYEKTARAWLRNMDAHRAAILSAFARTYGPDRARRWFARWRIFFLACAELFGYRRGEEWVVAHYLFDAARS
ncbi:MAG: class I SAM-dependent methyltransferase [Acidobacteriota bacterium]|nr:class I SAM-dependent methyltransferase [Acidobacteriota bacterium]